MVKAYLRFQHDLSIGVVASNCNGVFDRTGAFFITGALEGVAVWNARSGERVATLVDSDASLGKHPVEVKALARSNNEPLVAAGYSDGSIRVWDIDNRQLRVSFHGHKRPVTRLCFAATGGLLASGSQDTCVCLWDVIGEIGVVKLRGHSHEITGMAFLQDRQLLVSCAKDGQLKLWQLDSQHCCQTLLHERGVIWSLATTPKGSHVVVGSVDHVLTIYEICDGELPSLDVKVKVQRREDGRARSLVFSPDGKYLACRNATNSVEIFEVQSQEMAMKRLEKQHKEAKKILSELERKKTKEGSLDKKLDKKRKRSEKKLKETMEDIQLHKSVTLYECPSKAMSIDFRPGTVCELGIGLSNNAFEVVSFVAKEEPQEHLEAAQRLDIFQGGHRSGIRALSLSSDDRFLLSLSEKEAKIWNSETGLCLHTLPSGYGLAGMFAPGDSVVVIGTKAGVLELFDLQSSNMLGCVSGHEGPIWSVAPLRGNSGFVSAGADGMLNLWKWGLQQDKDTDSKRVTIRKSKKSMKLESDALAVKISPDGKWLAVALLDATIRIFYLDSFKDYLTLYGHKLPVLSIDISADSQLIASGSADKNVRIWGMDFGDCHKSLFAHNDSVTHVAFVHTTHYLMSVGKDGMLKYWDGDKFELLLALPGHHAEVWCLTVSHEGDFLFTGSNDRSIRKWARSDEPFFLEEEKEKRMEMMFDEDIKDDHALEDDRFPGRQTITTITAADSIVEALELTTLEAQRPSSDAPNPLLRGLEPSAFVLQTVQSIKTSDLETALLSLSFTDTLQLLMHLSQWIKQSCTQTETVCRVVVQLVQLHHHQLSTSFQARSVLQELQASLKTLTGDLKHTIGFNLEGVRFVRSLIPKDKTDRM